MKNEYGIINTKTNIENHWYAIYVPGGKEEQAKKLLEFHFKDELKFHVLKRNLKERKEGKWNKVERKLFPGYVLVNGNINNKIYYKLNEFNCTKINILKNGCELLTINESEIKVLGLLTQQKDDIIGISTLYKENDEIQVVDGPLIGLEGLILSVNKRKGRAKVSLDFIGEERVVELGIQVLEKT